MSPMTTHTTATGRHHVPTTPAIRVPNLRAALRHATASLAARLEQRRAEHTWARLSRSRHEHPTTGRLRSEWEAQFRGF